MFGLDPALRGNPEFQSALVRLGFWLFGISYIGLGAVTGYYQVERDYYFASSLPISYSSSPCW